MNCRDYYQVRNIWLVTVVVLLHIRIRLTAGSAYVPESEFINISYYEDCSCLSFNDTNMSHVMCLDVFVTIIILLLHFRVVRAFSQYGMIKYRF